MRRPCFGTRLIFPPFFFDETEAVPPNFELVLEAGEACSFLELEGAKRRDEAAGYYPLLFTLMLKCCCVGDITYEPIPTVLN